MKRVPLILVLTLMLSIACAAALPQPVPTPAISVPTRSTTHRITYSVTVDPPESRIDLSLTYANRYGDTEQVKARAPWQKTFTDVEEGTSLYVSVQNTTEFIRTVKCEIFVDGSKVRESSSKGAYVIATCSGRL